jgi:hypothetical protein
MYAADANMLEHWNDRQWGYAFTAAGICLIGTAYLLSSRPFVMSPSMDAVFLYGLAAFVVPIVAGYGWRTAAMTLGLTALVQLMGFLRHGLAAPGPLGVEALLVGLTALFSGGPAPAIDDVAERPVLHR